MNVLSVVIPTWNRAAVVCDAIESALSQRTGSVEVIVVDDASTDGTSELLAHRYGDRIRLLRLPRRSGPGAARNAGAAEASGELLAFLDSDDLWLPGKLDAELRVFERFPSAEAVISDSLSFTDGVAGERTRFGMSGLLAASNGEVRWINDCRWLWTNSANGVATCSITVRRSALERIAPPLFAEDLACCEDWEFEMRLYHGSRVVVLPEVWSHVRRFDDGSRIGRGELRLLQDRFEVMRRSQWLTNLDGELLAEFERCRIETISRLQSAGAQ